MSTPLDPTPATVDLGRLIGLVGRGALAIYAAFVFLYALIAVAGDPRTTEAPTALIALLLVAAGGAVLVIPTPTPLSRRLTTVVMVVAAVVPILQLVGLPAGGPVDYATWHLSAVNFLLFGLALRGRVGSAWISEAVMVTTMILWSVLATGDPWRGISLTYGHSASLIAGTLFALGLSSATRRILAVQAARITQQAELVAARERDARRSDELAMWRRDIVPTLRGIAEGELTDADRPAVRALEAGLRDRIRGTGLSREPLATRIREARLAGADVLLLDDAGASLTEPCLDVAATWAAEQMEVGPDGGAVIRLVRDGDAIVVHLTDDRGHRVRRLDGSD